MENKTLDEILEEIKVSIEKTLEAQSYRIGDREIRRPDLRRLAEYEDRMMARKIRQQTKGYAVVRFK